MQAATIGLDIAKSVFQVHGVDAVGQVVIRRQLKRSLCPGVLPEGAAMPGRHRGMRFVTSLVARTPGAWPHRAPDAASHVKPYVKRQKNDAADAEAICEAVTRANIRYVATKTPEQQSGLMLHRTRHLFICQQTAVINAIRAHLARSTYQNSSPVRSSEPRILASRNRPHHESYSQRIVRGLFQQPARPLCRFRQPA
jgi:transposase